jgi:arylsulfatase A-like enzyme
MRPNFLFFITDQHRADNLGCSGHPVLKTPHIDSIAARGMRFELKRNDVPAGRVRPLAQ